MEHGIPEPGFMNQNNYKNVLPSGFRLDCYEIDSVIGAGGFGITYRAKDTSLDTWVALKEYFPIHLAAREADGSVCARTEDDITDYEYGCKQFIEEGRTIAKFNHPNILRVLRHFEANGSAYLVLEYLDGQSLKDYISSHPSPNQKLISHILDGLLNGLEAVHSLDYLHRDIKPSNIFIRQDGTPVLIDFGSSRLALNRHTQSLTHIISEGFAAFEQYPGNLRMTEATDVYSLGATLYYLITGLIPPNSLARVSDTRAGSEDPLIPLSRLNLAQKYHPGFLNLIDWMLAIDAENRPQSVNQIKLIIASNNFPNPTPAHETRENNQPLPQQTPARPVNVKSNSKLVIAALMFSTVSVIVMAAMYYHFVKNSATTSRVTNVNRSTQTSSPGIKPQPTGNAYGTRKLPVAKTNTPATSASQARKTTDVPELTNSTNLGKEISEKITARLNSRHITVVHPKLAPLSSTTPNRPSDIKELDKYTKQSGITPLFCQKITTLTVTKPSSVRGILDCTRIIVRGKGSLRFSGNSTNSIFYVRKGGRLDVSGNIHAVINNGGVVKVKTSNVLYTVSFSGSTILESGTFKTVRIVNGHYKQGRNAVVDQFHSGISVTEMTGSGK